MKTLRRTLVILLIVFAVLILGFIGVMLTDALALDEAATVTNVSYPAADGSSLIGYLAQPAAATTELRPAVLMVHEWWGLNHEITEMANLLAEEGYIVLAPDTYRGRLATTVPGALFLRIGAPVERVNSDMQAAYDYLVAQPGVDPARVAVMGFCYGGGVALRHATLNAQIAATINLYGDTIDTVDGFGELLTSGKPLLGIFGEVDQQIPVSEVETFRQTLAETTIPHQVTIYPGVGHAFVNPQSIIQPGAAQDAWHDIRVFLAAALA